MSDRFSSDVLSIDVDGHVATLWLDRPAARNALGPAFWVDLPRAMAELSGDDRVRAVVVAARGPHFSVGLDLKAMAGLLSGAGDGDPSPSPAASSEAAPSPSAPSPAAKARATRATVVRLQAAITAVADCPKPVVAAVHGYCIGGGVDLIAACDIRLASADAVFSVREAKVAIVADLGSLQRLPHILGAGHVAELAFTGKDVDADRAMRIGLVNDVLADPDALLAAARSLAATIAANSPVAVQGTKAVLAANDGRTVADGLDYVATWNAGMIASDDLTEAMTAFLEKRPPKFTGR
ncbi:MAG TPA: crotonase/enoyl-CoA hydratase family protein [Acidimicrobiales bacterium]